MLHNHVLHCNRGDVSGGNASISVTRCRIERLKRNEMSAHVLYNIMEFHNMLYVDIHTVCTCIHIVNICSYLLVYLQKDLM